MKKPKPKRPPIEIVIAFAVVTEEKFNALPETVKDGIGRVLYDFFIRLAEQEAGGREALRLAA